MIYWNIMCFLGINKKVCKRYVRQMEKKIYIKTGETPKVCPSLHAINQSSFYNTDYLKSFISFAVRSCTVLFSIPLKPLSV